jgi:hypothetical protein
MFLGKKRVGALALSLASMAFACMAFAWSGSSKAEITLAEANGWAFSTDGRVNGFVTHLWGDDRPDGGQGLQWVGFNETGQISQENASGKLRRTRIRSGYVPSTLAFNVKRQLKSGLKLGGRIEIGVQIANTSPSAAFEPTWMDPRSAYLEVSDAWGSVKIGRDLSLFPRGNLVMNYELGHAYGVGFPCTYELVFGGACGHVGFGTLWPDFRPQITYSTPNFGDVFQVSLGLLDPRTVPTYNFFQIPLPRVEGEAVAKYMASPDFGFKAWANGAWQQIGIGVHTPDTVNGGYRARKVYTTNAYGGGGGLIGYLGPFKAGVSGYLGKGMDAYEFLTFNPVFVSRANIPNQSRRFRPTRGFLAEASFTLGSTWVMGGFGQAQLDRMPSDTPIQTVGEPPLLRSQTGISAGLFHRIDSFVLGLDYFNARYGFDASVVALPTPHAVSSSQVFHTVSGGGTLEW